MNRQENLELKLKEVEHDIEEKIFGQKTSLVKILPDTVFTQSGSELLHEMAKIYATEAERLAYTGKSRSLSSSNQTKALIEKFDLPTYGDASTRGLQKIAELVADKPENERLIAYSMTNELLNMTMGCDCHGCDSNKKKPMVRLFGIEAYKGRDWGNSPNSLPGTDIIRDVLIQTCAEYAGVELLNEEAFKKEKSHLDALITLEKRGINTDILEEKQPELYNTIDTVPHVFAFDEESGVVATIDENHWYQQLSSGRYRIGTAGGVGMAKVVTVFKPNGEVKSDSFTWRDQYDSRKDNYENAFRNIKDITVANSQISVLTETREGDRTLTYSIE